MKGESESPINMPLPIKVILKPIFRSVSYCVVILRTTPQWSVRMTSCNFRLLIREQQMKITFAAWVRTNSNNYHGARGFTLLLHPLWSSHSVENTLTYNVLNGQAPSYIKDMLQSYRPIRNLRSSPRNHTRDFTSKISKLR